MSTTDPNSIEYLSLEIKSSTEEAVKALNALTEALDKVITSTSSLKDAAANVSTFGKSMTSLASGIKSAILASKDLTFKGSEAEIRALDKTVRKMATDTLSAFGIKNKRVAADLKGAFAEMAEAYQNGRSGDDAYNKSLDLIRDNTHIVADNMQRWVQFAKEIDSLGRKGVKFNTDLTSGDFSVQALDRTESELRNAAAAEKAISRLFTKDSVSKDGPSQTFNEWAHSLAQTYSDIISFSDENANNDSENASRIAQAYMQAKRAVLDYDDAVKKGYTNGLTAEDAVYDSYANITNMLADARKKSDYSAGSNNVLGALADSANNLSEIDFGSVEKTTQLLNSLSGSLAGISSNGISNVGKSLGVLANSLSKLSAPEGWPDIAHFLVNINEPLRAFEGLNLPDFKPLRELQKAMSGFSEESYTIAATNISAMTPVLKDFAKEMNSVEFVELGDLSEMIKTVTKFGHANMDKAISNMPNLTDALKELVSQLNQLPEVNDKTLRLVEALGQLKLKGLDANKELTRASGGANLFGKAAHKARGHTNGLIGTFVKARAVIYALRRAFDALKGSINLASDLIEVQNVVDVTFGNYQEHLESIAKNSIETYGTSELTFKSVASQFQAMGSAMGIGNTQIRQATDNLNKMGVAYGETTGQMGDMATTLTELAADMASFYNKDIEDVQTALTSVYTGQTRPLKVAA